MVALLWRGNFVSFSVWLHTSQVLIRKTRRLVQRGDTLMRGGYRLAQISSLGKGRFEFTVKRP